MSDRPDPQTSFLALCDHLLQDENGITWDAYDLLWDLGKGLGYDMQIVTAACESAEGRIFYSNSAAQFTGTEVING